jgi:hypothetical protein
MGGYLVFYGREEPIELVFISTTCCSSLFPMPIKDFMPLMDGLTLPPPAVTGIRLLPGYEI